MTTFIEYVINNDLDGLKKAFENAPAKEQFVNAIDQQKRSCLEIAVQNNNIALIQLLLTWNKAPVCLVTPEEKNLLFLLQCNNAARVILEKVDLEKIPEDFQFRIFSQAVNGYHIKIINILGKKFSSEKKKIYVNVLFNQDNKIFGKIEQANAFLLQKKLLTTLLDWNNTPEIFTNMKHVDNYLNIFLNADNRTNDRAFELFQIMINACNQEKIPEKLRLILLFRLFDHSWKTPESDIAALFKKIADSLSNDYLFGKNILSNHHYQMLASGENKHQFVSQDNIFSAAVVDTKNISLFKVLIDKLPYAPSMESPLNHTKIQVCVPADNLVEVVKKYPDTPEQNKVYVLSNRSFQKGETIISLSYKNNTYTVCNDVLAQRLRQKDNSQQCPVYWGLGEVDTSNLKHKTHLYLYPNNKNLQAKILFKKDGTWHCQIFQLTQGDIKDAIWQSILSAKGPSTVVSYYLGLIVYELKKQFKYWIPSFDYDNQIDLNQPKHRLYDFLGGIIDRLEDKPVLFKQYANIQAYLEEQVNTNSLTENDSKFISYFSEVNKNLNAAINFIHGENELQCSPIAFLNVLIEELKNINFTNLPKEYAQAVLQAAFEKLATTLDFGLFIEKDSKKYVNPLGNFIEFIFDLKKKFNIDCSVSSIFCKKATLYYLNSYPKIGTAITWFHNYLIKLNQHTLDVEFIQKATVGLQNSISVTNMEEIILSLNPLFEKIDTIEDIKDSDSYKNLKDKIAFYTQFFDHFNQMEYELCQQLIDANFSVNDEKNILIQEVLDVQPATVVMREKNTIEKQDNYKEIIQLHYPYDKFIQFDLICAEIAVMPINKDETETEDKQNFVFLNADEWDKKVDILFEAINAAIRTLSGQFSYVNKDMNARLIMRLVSALIPTIKTIYENCINLLENDLQIVDLVNNPESKNEESTEEITIINSVITPEAVINKIKTSMKALEVSLIILDKIDHFESAFKAISQLIGSQDDVASENVPLSSSFSIAKENQELSMLQNFNLEEDIIKMEKYFKSASFDRSDAKHFMQAALDDPRRMTALTCFLYHKLTVKNELNSKYTYFIRQPKIKSAIIQHILNLPVQERFKALQKVFTEQKSNLSQCCLKGSLPSELTLLKNEWTNAQKNAQPVPVNSLQQIQYSDVNPSICERPKTTLFNPLNDSPHKAKVSTKEWFRGKLHQAAEIIAGPKNHDPIKHNKEDDSDPEFSKPLNY
ncbi:MAG: hypothetical protein HKM04_03365 [Legionellales bacterium]|nr:hypothetical protein [Legionellales bacterium]